MIKKLFAVLVLALFVLSVVPMAFGDNQENGAQLQVNEENSKEDTQDLEEMDDNHEEEMESDLEKETETEELEPLKEQDRDKEQIREEIKEKTEEKIAKLDEKIEETKEKYATLKEKKDSALKSFQEQKENLIQIKERVKSCLEDNENCSEIKKDLRQGTEIYLLKTNEVISSSVEKLYDQVRDSKNINEVEKEVFITELDSRLEKLKLAQDELEAMTEEATAQEIQDKIKELKKTWTEIKQEQKKIIASLINAKLDNLVEKLSSDYPTKMQEKIESLAANDNDVTELEELLKAYNEKAQEIKEMQKNAQEQIIAGEMEGYQQSVDKLKEKMLESKELLRQFMNKEREQSEIAKQKETMKEAAMEEAETGATLEE